MSLNEPPVLVAEYRLEGLIEDIKLTNKMSTLAEYTRVPKGKEIYDLAIAIYDDRGCFNHHPNLLEIVDFFGLSRWRTVIVADCLEETRFMPTGTYERLKKKLKPTKRPPSTLERLESLKSLLEHSQTGIS